MGYYFFKMSAKIRNNSEFYFSLISYCFRSSFSGAIPRGKARVATLHSSLFARPFGLGASYPTTPPLAPTIPDRLSD